MLSKRDWMKSIGVANLLVLFLCSGMLLPDQILGQERPRASAGGRPAGGRGNSGRPPGGDRGNAVRPESARTDQRAESTTGKPSLPAAWADQTAWRPIGPANMGGRITAIAVDEKNPSTWWAASASGGLIKTTNNGTTFEHQFDRQTTVSIGDVQVAPSNPEVVWVGTGESNPRNSVSWGDGVYRSIDGGKTWKNMGLEKTFQTGAIAIHPENPDVVWVGSLGRLWGENKERGLFKTSDGGTTWTTALYIDKNTGVVDVQVNRKNPNELLVATYERKRDGFDGNDPVQRYGAESGIYKSIDGGASFKKITDGLPTCKMGRIGIDYFDSDPNFVVAVIESEKIAKQPETSPFIGIRGEDADVGARLVDVTKDSPADKAGLKVGDIVVSLDGLVAMSWEGLLAEMRKHQAGDKIEVVVSRQREKIVLEVELAKMTEAMLKRENTPFNGTLGGQAENLQEQQGDAGFEFGGIYLSENGGDSWTRINSLNPRPMYYSNIQFDPIDRNNIFLCGTSLYRSFDGGKTFKGDGGTDGIHVDHHALWIDPANPRHMILGNDGGIYVTYDQMEHWDHLNHVAIGQFYHVGIDSNRDYNVYGGMQDNGSWGGPARGKTGEGPVNTDWLRIGGGDGFVTQVDPTDAAQIYYESQNGGMGRINLKTGEQGFMQPQERGQRFRFNWKAPFILSPHNSKIHYSAGNFVFRSLNKGSNPKRISPEITNSKEGAGSAISESPIADGLIFVGTTDGAVWMTSDGGNDWQPLFYVPKKPPTDPAKDAEKAPAASPEEAESSEDQTNPPVEKTAADLPTDEPVVNAEAGDIKTAVKPSENPAAVTPTAVSPPVEPAEDLAALEDDVTGDWSGVIENENLPGGRLEFTIHVKKDEKNQLSGTVESAQGDSEITDGFFDPDQQKISFEAENEAFAYALKGDLTVDGMSGVVLVNDGELELEFTATRIKEEPKQEDVEVAASKRETVQPQELKQEETQQEETKQEETKQEETKQEETQQEETKQEETKQEETKQEETESATEPKPTTVDAPANAVTGRWTGQLVSPRGEQELTLNLTMTANDNITGTFESTRGERDITSGSFDPQTKQLSLTLASDQFSMEFSGALAEEKYTGNVDINGGAMTMTFSVERQSKVAGAAEPATESKSPTPTKEYKQPTGDKTLSALLPGPRWVSSIEASRFKRERCYITFDGHRSDDDGVYLFVTNDTGKTWASLKGNLPDSAGSVLVLREDIKNENMLYLGCEFSAWFSIDLGQSWTQIKGDFPTVAVHDFAIHPTAGEVVAATHGRSLWIGDVSVLRQVSAKTIAADAFLYQPQEAILWRRQPGRGDTGPRRFVGKNPENGTKLAYSLGKNASAVSLEIQDLKGETIKTFEAPNRQGLHVVNWTLDQGQAGSSQRFGRTVAPGNYLVILKVDGERKNAIVAVANQPLTQN